MNRSSILLVASLLGFAFTASAQNAAPVVIKTIPEVASTTVYQSVTPASIDLTAAFQDQDFSKAVRVTTVEGTFDLALYDRQKPITVANFLRYVNEGRYFATDPTTQQQASSFFHRSVSAFVLQGGGFLGTVNPNGSGNAQPTQVGTLPAIQNEPGISNRRATIAMAKTSQPNSATSQWFVNLADNTGLDDPNLASNTGGFAVFGRVLGAGMNVVDRIAGLPLRNAGNPFDSLPVRNLAGGDAVKVPNLVSVPAIAEIAPVPSPLRFSATTDNPLLLDVQISDNNLLIVGKTVGTANVTITATDLDGATVSQTTAFNVIAAPGRLGNISTRLEVGEGASVPIGGFILRGNTPKRLVIRAIGPSLGAVGISNPLADPRIELRDSSQQLIASSDNWGDDNKQAIIDAKLNPSSSREAVIFTTLPSSQENAQYTAILRGPAGASGIALVEIYDADSGPGSAVMNISTRGKVGDGERVMIGGFIVQGSDAKRFILRAIGPALADFGVTGALNNPKLTLRNGQGTVVGANDNWTSNRAEVEATGLQPSKDAESAIVATLPAGGYTAILEDAGNQTTGIALVEVYQIQ